MPIAEYKTKPWQVSCDECGERAGIEESGGFVLFDSRDEAVHEMTTIFEWRVVGEVITCPACLDEEALSAVPPSPGVATEERSDAND